MKVTCTCQSVDLQTDLVLGVIIKHVCTYHIASKMLKKKSLSLKIKKLMGKQFIGVIDFQLSRDYVNIIKLYSFRSIYRVRHL